MALLNKRLTDREKAAIYLHVFGGVDDWKLLYMIADNGPEKAPEQIDRSVASKWKNSGKIQALIQSISSEKAAIMADGIDRGKRAAEEERAESVRTNSDEKPARAKYVDYSSPAAQRAKLNELINTASDPGEALDALKVIIQGQRADREAAKEGRVNRVYLPLTCDSCPMYQKARKRAEKATEKGPEEL